uniref:Uncharacterized protein n=2 Tax=Cucumis sativus TaxID=3659 RepID=A0A0A0KBX7_CUCSA
MGSKQALKFTIFLVILLDLHTSTAAPSSDYRASAAQSYRHFCCHSLGLSPLVSLLGFPSLSLSFVYCQHLSIAAALPNCRAAVTTAIQLSATAVAEFHLVYRERPMSISGSHEEEDDHGEVFLDEADIIHEVPVDEEDLPDAVDEEGSDDEYFDEADDSVHTFTGHTGEVYTVVCSPVDATLVATGGGDDKGFMWKIGRGDFAQELSGHKDSVSSLAFSADGQLLASGSFDGIIQIWDTSSGNLKCTLEGPGGGIEWVRWHPRGHLVLAGSEDSTAWMWNADRGIYLNIFSGHGASVTCGDFTPDGKIICTGSDDATMRIWNPRSGENIHVVRGHPYHTEGLTSLALTSDSTLALTGSKDGSVHIVNIATGKVVNSLVSHSDSIECIGLAPSSPWAATGGMDQKLIIWDLQQSTPRSTCQHEDGVTCLTWIGTSRYLATGCVDGRVRIWDSLSGECVKTFSGHSDAIQSLAVCANLEYLVSVALDNTARIFEIAEYH